MMATEATERSIDIPIAGMDCAECVRHVEAAIAAVPGVRSVNVLLSAEKATVRIDPRLADPSAIRAAVAGAGHAVPEATVGPERSRARQGAASGFARQALLLLGVVFAAVLFVVVGEWLGLVEAVTVRVPWPLGALAVLAFGFPIFRGVVRDALRRRVGSHAPMTVGALAALAVGQWATAAVVVFFMRVGAFAEAFTTERSRRALRDLSAMAPLTARVERDGAEVKVPVDEVRVGETVVVRPGERSPVDGDVVAGLATVDQAAITGESMPVEAGPGARVYAATVATLGNLRVRATGVGAGTTFGRVVRLVEEAEANRADVQRIADRFAAWYLPVVVTLAALTFLVRRDPLATTAVLVVACSCSFALAMPIAILASVGAAAKRGLLVKGGKHLGTLARADVLLIDKMGTLTLGEPRLTDVVPLNGLGEDDLLALAAAVERYSEHPLAAAVRVAAAARRLPLSEPVDFRAVPGRACGRQSTGIGSRSATAEWCLAPQRSPPPPSSKRQARRRSSSPATARRSACSPRPTRCGWRCRPRSRRCGGSASGASSC